MIRGLISLSRDQGTWSVALLVRSNDKNEDDAIDDSSATSTVKIQMLHISRTNIIKVDDSKVVMLPKGQIVDGSCMVHPPTYINKVIVSGCDANGNGVLLLVNIRTGTIIYQYKSVHKREPVHTMIATPAVDTLAIATERSHKVQIIHLKLDRIIMTFQHNQRIESMSFSTMSRVAYLAVASGCKLHLWDLNDRRLMHHRTSHQKNTILTCAFLPNSTTLIYSTRFSVTKLNIEILDDGAQDKHQQNTKIVELVTRGGAKEGVSSLELGQYDAGLVLYGCGESLWRRHMYTGTLTRALTRENM
jgi:WD40 repeat protein